MGSIALGFATPGIGINSAIQMQDQNSVSDGEMPHDDAAGFLRLTGVSSAHTAS